MFFFRLNIADFGLNKTNIFTLAILTLTAGFFEGFGMTMLLPILEYIEKGSNISDLAESSPLWEYLLVCFNTWNLQVNLIGLLVIVFLLIVLRVVAVFFRQVYNNWLVQKIQHTTRCSLLSSFLYSDYSHLDENATGWTVNTTTTEVQRVGASFIALFALISNTVVVTGFIIVLFLISAEMTLAAIFLITLGATMVSFFVRQTKSFSLKTTESNKNLSFMLIERLTSVRLIKISAAVNQQINRFSEASGYVKKNMFRLRSLRARVELILEPCVVAAAMIILYLAVEELSLSLSEIGIFMLVLLRLLPLSKELLKSRQTLFSNYGSLLAVQMALENSRNSFEDINVDGLEFNQLKHGVTFKAVDYTYPGGSQSAIKGITLFLPANRMIAVVGPSGAGKSTLADLLPLLRKPQKGQLLFDNRPITEYNLESIRRGIAFVSQEASIFNDTVRNNILFACENATDDELWLALKRARCDEFVRSLPSGLETVLGERGAKLSGGQRQRVSLARSFVRQASILILDEPTSALDSEVERDIQEAITELRQKKNTTIIIIAHRLSTIRQADIIIVMEDGKVVQQGTHDQLIASKKWYAMVNELQQT